MSRPRGDTLLGSNVREAARETALQRCTRYRQLLKLPVVVTPGSGRITVHVLPGLLDAVTMPSALGSRTAARLAQTRQLGPVVAHPLTGRATFLTGPGLGCDHDISSMLVSLNVGFPATYVVLPSPWDERNMFRQWLVEPSSSYLPEMRAVLHAALAVSTDGPHTLTRPSER